ncbi:MAG: hypothetical protein ACRDQA_02365 [Nocardioidaceae bacterium]
MSTPTASTDLDTIAATLNPASASTDWLTTVRAFCAWVARDLASAKGTPAIDRRLDKTRAVWTRANDELASR